MSTHPSGRSLWQQDLALPPHETVIRRRRRRPQRAGAVCGPHDPWIG
jgi:hypothetical protein